MKGMKMKKLHNHSMRLTISALSLLMASGFAQAAMVTQWGYTTNAVFSAPSWSGNDGIAGTTSTVSASELAWGWSAGNIQSPSTDSSLNRSALTVGNVVTGSLTGGGPAIGSVQTNTDLTLSGSEIGKGISFTHWNNVLNGNYETLRGATITDTLTLTPELPGGGPSQAGPTLVFNFQFRETPNAGTNGLCADGLSAVGNYGYSAAGGGCPDLFGFIGTQTVNQSFIYDGFQYFASVLSLNADGTLDAIGIGALTSGECSALNLDGDPLAAGNQCFGFRTLETTNTTERFGVAISAVRLPSEVPEPGAIALIGIALAGLGLVRVRRQG